MKKLILVLLVISAIFTMAPKKPKPRGITGYEIVQETHTLCAACRQTFQVNCPDNKLVLGGGGSGTGLEESYPGPSGLSWIMTMDQGGVEPTEISVYAICADVVR